MAWTTPRSWTSGETVTAALLNSHLRDQLLFINDRDLGYASRTSDQTLITAEVDLTSLSVAVTVDTSRRVRVTADLMVTSTVATDHVAAYIKEGSTYLQQRQVSIGRANSGESLQMSVILTPSAGAHTYKLALARVAGTGNVSSLAAATYPASIYVEDLGGA